MSDYNIVDVNVSQILAATPSTLQKTGCIVSQGSTTLSEGQYQLITGISDFTDIASQDPEPSVVTAFNSFFSQGKTQAVYVLELGPAVNVTYDAEKYSEPSEAYTVVELSGVTKLAEYINDPGLRMYTYLVPSYWYDTSAFMDLVKQYANDTAMLYFFIDTVVMPAPGVPYVSKYPGNKAVIVSANQSNSECPSAALMWNFLNADPSEVNKLAPFSFRYVFGLTALTLKNFAKSAFKKAYVNYIGTGAEGGISNTIIFGGFTCDGKDMMEWYAVDWVQINAALTIANTVINGSNNAQNPLYYDQPGINRIQSNTQSTMSSATAFGIANGTPQVSCIPFKKYITDNPGHYNEGKYAGVYVTFVPNRGFKNIVFNLTVDFSGQSLLS